jgi:hypothetical protein
MSVLGQQPSSNDVCVTSAITPIAARKRTLWHFAFGPLNDVSWAFALSIVAAHPAPFPVLSFDILPSLPATAQTSISVWRIASRNRCSTTRDLACSAYKGRSKTPARAQEVGLRSRYLEG